MKQNLLLVAIIFLSVFQTNAQQSNKKPNVIFFLIDDMGYGDLGTYGSTFHETPNIDQIASEGMKFTQGYSACTVCSPSRGAILTGRYPGRTHLTDFITGHTNQENPKLKIPDWKMYMEHDRTLLPEVMQDAGYATQFVGKWHLIPREDTQEIQDQHFPESHGFDINVAGCAMGMPRGRGKYFYPFDMPNLEGEKGDYLTDRLTDESLVFLEENKDNPFFLYFSFYLVHGPIMGKKEYIQKYENKEASGGQSNPKYAAMVQALDENIGRVTKKLKELGLDKNTIIILTADNGGTRTSSSGGLRGSKGLSYEGAVREPFIVKWPGVVKPETVCNTPVIGMDVYPTILEMIGLDQKKEEHMDGVSLVSLLKQEGSIDRETLYWHYPHYHATKPYGAIRHKDMKLIEFFEDGDLELYDLKNDPSETTNLATTRPKDAKKLLAMMQQWREDVGAQMPTPNPNYDPNYVKKGKH